MEKGAGLRFHQGELTHTHYTTFLLPEISASLKQRLLFPAFFMPFPARHKVLSGAFRRIPRPISANYDTTGYNSYIRAVHTAGIARKKTTLQIADLPSFNLIRRFSFAPQTPETLKTTRRILRQRGFRYSSQFSSKQTHLLCSVHEGKRLLPMPSVITGFKIFCYGTFFYSCYGVHPHGSLRPLKRVDRIQGQLHSF